EVPPPETGLWPAHHTTGSVPRGPESRPGSCPAVLSGSQNTYSCGRPHGRPTGRLSPTGEPDSGPGGRAPLEGRVPASSGTISLTGMECSAAFPVHGRAHTSCCTPPAWRGRLHRPFAYPADVACWIPFLAAPTGSSAGSPNGLPNRLAGRA